MLAYVIISAVFVLLLVGTLPGFPIDGIIGQNVTGKPYRWRYRKRTAREPILERYERAAREGADPTTALRAYQFHVGCAHLRDFDAIDRIFDAYREYLHDQMRGAA